MNWMDRFYVFVTALGAITLLVAGVMLLDAMKAIALGAGDGIFF